MRIILFFDLPIETNKQVNEYTRFRKHLLKTGFQMLQKSVYIKLAVTKAKAEAVIEQIKRHLPTKGHIEVLIITEKQFANIITILGEHESSIVSNLDKVVEL